MFSIETSKCRLDFIQEIFSSPHLSTTSFPTTCICNLINRQDSTPALTKNNQPCLSRSPSVNENINVCIIILIWSLLFSAKIFFYWYGTVKRFIFFSASNFLCFFYLVFLSFPRKAIQSPRRKENVRKKYTVKVREQ